MPRKAAVAFSFALLFASGHSAIAQSATPIESTATLAEAKELFRKGVALFTAGDIERALDYFRRSRATVASKQNTINAAICLDRLGRFDEALDLYEEVVATYGAALTNEERASLPALMATLRTKLGAIDVAANVAGGALVIDGRERAKLPLATPIRVMPGAHLVRVLKDGYISFETHIDIALGALRTIDAKLEPLSAAGGLRVEDPALAGAEVIVDGVTVGIAPWEGTLAPGPHVVVSRKEGLGSAPTLAIVLQGQTALVRLHSGILGPITRIATSPPTAELRLNDVSLGHGNWEGMLPSGDYALRVSEEGYFEQTLPIHVAANGEAPPRTVVTLAVNTLHPRWPKPPSGNVIFGASIGAGLSPSLHSGAESRCVTACDRSLVSGEVITLRAGYELGIGLAIELAGGYVDIHAPLNRVLSNRFISDNGSYIANFALHDDVRLAGFFVGPAIGYRARLGRGWGLRSRISVGALLAKSTDPVVATTFTGSENASALVQNAHESVSSTAFFTSFDLGVERTFGKWRIGAGLAAFVVPSSGASAFNHTAILTQSSTCTTANPGAVGCVPESAALQGERAYGPFVLVMPQITLSWLP